MQHNADIGLFPGSSILALLAMAEGINAGSWEVVGRRLDAGYDFKRLFTISEYFDRDRPTFYKSIQSVRENGMDLSAYLPARGAQAGDAQGDMTGWLDYFVTGPETQMIEMRERSGQVIRSLQSARERPAPPAITFWPSYDKL
jgi:hypothetical protein